ncbi:MAG: 30S ribosomal protein S2 [Verrucomicrobia bacterium CG_4_10_14_3_um_filter_43_23]|nr:MAG: 30S ribosomal protein S2 [Verrucomicrobia bacterium CG1_02_43_26]PIP59558.1 MAG: 30S ribosomal protein S2 [Verrucomicrobia bacterium CG22_combo_CG10-13_8_21_14_all_43_17]PIX58858.1 MAG: 30S ribosomal protein S2 [Verrucomicrobia bacterium CG_4_10_14_3_um_filter_43_23]PIY60953.1 MAG: 30S ribosomal protein S2 [Verrucomicrobia bacterium CG_4_10_14_0_8_um_filter_43_34]PJA44868.1 MAG: 30S ribosomal protein S2 [Verrucomicrobia bacterium CG_4_9_14_3_um_filter_43_20]
MNITIEDLFEAGVHFGHQKKRWNPKSKDIVFSHEQGISIIDLEKTYKALEDASKFIEDIVSSGKDIMFVGTKRQAQEVVRESARRVNMPFAANRWLGGTLTNFSTVSRSLAKYKKFLGMEADGTFDKMFKKELAAIKREMSRMHRNFEGMLEVNNAPGALFVVDVKKEYIAVAEANRLGIPVIAIVDTNSDPACVKYPVPGNDDAVKSIRILCDVICEAVQQGLARREEVKTQRAPKQKFTKDFREAEPQVTLTQDLRDAAEAQEQEHEDAKKRKAAAAVEATEATEGTEPAAASENEK